uniref:F-box domain-containing protein n=1 Tax=Panagrellus redivivus TaxID=6233 RepID=A0A7E4VJT9_PANRE
MPPTSASPPLYPSPSTVTMASNSQLPNHLIRELMNTIRFKGDGDAMVLLALSGKEMFPVFRYVVETHVFAVMSEKSISLQSLHDRLLVVLNVLKEGSVRLTIRFIRDLRAYCISSEFLPLENIKLTIFGGLDKSFTPIFNSFTGLEVLKFDFCSNRLDDFLNEVNDGNISLTNLRRLQARLVADDLMKIMSTTSSFPLPEDVSVNLDLHDVVPDLGSLQTFPNVKRLVMNISLKIGVSSAVLHQFSIIINCFTGLVAAKVQFSCDHYAEKNEFAEVLEFHEWLRNTNFSFPVEVNFQEIAKLDYPESPKIIYDQLKSIGYEEDGIPTYFVLKRQYGNVKLNHQIKNFDDYNYEGTDDEYWSDSDEWYPDDD